MKLRQKEIKPARIEMIPLIDIVFLLLVFFIYAMLSMAVHSALPVHLPSSAAVQLDTEKTIAITLQADGETLSIFVDEEPVDLEVLTSILSLKGNSNDNNDTEVQIYGDQTISYQQLFEVLDRIKAAGLNRISLAAEAEKQ